MIFKRARKQFASQGECKLERDMGSILPEPGLTQKTIKTSLFADCYPSLKCELRAKNIGFKNYRVFNAEVAKFFVFSLRPLRL